MHDMCSTHGHVTDHLKVIDSFAGVCFEQNRYMKL